MYQRVIEDGDAMADAEIEVTSGSRIVYVEARYVTRPVVGDQEVMLCYDRKQALKLSLALLIAIVRSFRRFR